MVSEGRDALLGHHAARLQGRHRRPATQQPAPTKRAAGAGIALRIQNPHCKGRQGLDQRPVAQVPHRPCSIERTNRRHHRALHRHRLQFSSPAPSGAVAQSHPASQHLQATPQASPVQTSTFCWALPVAPPALSVHPPHHGRAERAATGAKARLHRLPRSGFWPRDGGGAVCEEGGRHHQAVPHHQARAPGGGPAG